MSFCGGIDFFFGRLEPDGREGDGTGKLGEDVVEGGCGWEAGENGLWEGYSFSIGLTRREAEIFLLLLEERSNQEIGAAFGVVAGVSFVFAAVGEAGRGSGFAYLIFGRFCDVWRGLFV